jgi:predicted butyrate kinase (DUF1464 family)
VGSGDGWIWLTFLVITLIVAGIDAGTSGYEIFIMEDCKPLTKLSFSGEEVKENPDVIVDALKSWNVDVAAGLSGYGLPVKKFSELTDREIFLMTLNLDKNATLGLRMLIEVAKRSDLPIYTVPGVIHLDTVPKHRKMNRIDIGTSDKLCSVALALATIEELVEQNFILGEIGYGFSAFIAVEKGRIVDGLGGTSSFPGWSSLGFMDAELAYLLGDFEKSLVFSGGVRSFAADKGLDEKEACEILAEFAAKSIKALEPSMRWDRIILSGSRARGISKRLSEILDAEITILKGFGIAKQSAEGAAVIAEGIEGGEYSWVVERLRIKEARGTVIDYITSDVLKHLKRIF